MAWRFLKRSLLLLGGAAVLLLTESVAQDVGAKNVAPQETNHDFRSKHFLGSGNCDGCHNHLEDRYGNDVSIVNAWRATMMANAARDPLWQAKVASELHRTPTKRAAIEKKCSRCHMPMANVEAGWAKEPIRIFGPKGFLNPKHPRFDMAMEGVSCTLCHQIEKNDPKKPTRRSGNYVIGQNEGVERKIYGPFKDPFPWPMRNILQITPTYSAHMNQSEHCASCHDLDTHAFDKDGGDLKVTFHEQSTYSEWKASLYSKKGQKKSCQDCHMPKAKSAVVISNIPRGRRLSPRSPFYQHSFMGGNTFMLDIFNRNKESLGLRDEDFASTIRNSRKLLKSAVRMTVLDESQKGHLSLTVQLKNQSGHKFPTGYPSRRAWIYLRVQDKEKKTVFESGAMDGKGRIKVASDATRKRPEPHHDLIEKSSQVQIYEAAMKDERDQWTFTLLRAVGYLKDNRLLPAGLNKKKASKKTRSAGRANQDKDFLGGSDTVRYRIPLAPGQYSVLIELRYQSVSYPFAQDLFEDSRAVPAVKRYEALHKGAKIVFERLQKVENTVELR